MAGKEIAKPKPDAVATALFIGILHIFIKGTVIDPPPIPIKEDKAPIRDPIIGTAKPVGTETNTSKLLGPKMKCRKTTIITNANNAHLGEFGSEENLVKAKGEILESLTKDGVALINIASPHKETWHEMSSTQSLTFFGKGSRIYPSEITESKSHINFNLNYSNASLNVNLSMIGLHQVDNALAAAACAIALGIESDVIKKGLENTLPEKGRLELIELENFKILDDSYNANPESMKAAIDCIGNFTGEKVLVLGSMGELGMDSKKLHQEIGDYVRQSKIDHLLTIGEDAKEYQGQQFEDINSIFKSIQTNHQGSTILIKGSRMMRLNELVDNLVNSENSS